MAIPGSEMERGVIEALFKGGREGGREGGLLQGREGRLYS